MSSPARKTSRRRRLFAAALVLAAGAGAFFGLSSARAESPVCADLRNQIANAGSDGTAARYRAAAAKQRGEYSRLAARAHAMGCDREQFLFFGDAPPGQCGPINAQLAALRNNVSGYEQAASSADEGRRRALAARYDAECRDQHIITARAPRPRNFFDELFGVPPDETSGLREVPVGPADMEPREGEDDDRAVGGSMAICVRSCDGGFFPVSYSARSANLDELSNLCKALCPNAEVKLYTRSPWKDMDNALSIDGEPYSEHPNALKFQKTYDPACGCKPRGQTWAEALAEAERILAASHNNDVVVTEEQAEKLSRPIPLDDPRYKKPKNASTRQDAPAPEAAAATAPTTPGAADDVARAPEVYRDVIGSDGVKRRVRVVAPAL